MADFNLAQPLIIRNEGGYVNDPQDSGGETYCGISRNNFPTWPWWKFIDGCKPLHKGWILDSLDLDAGVNSFYRRNFWDKCHLDDMKNQSVAAYFYDFNVNAGTNATKRLQIVLAVSVDGICGHATINAANAYSGDLLEALHRARIDYYCKIAVGNNEKFLQGWVNRAKEMYDKLK